MEREINHMVPNQVNMEDGSLIGSNLARKLHCLSSCVSGYVFMVPEEPPQLISREFVLPGIENLWYAVVCIPACNHCPLIN